MSNRIHHGIPDWPTEDLAHLFVLGLDKGFRFTHHSTGRNGEGRDDPSQHSPGRDLSRRYFCAPLQLIQKLEAVLKESKGGSILVSGYRGTGKTSLVNEAIRRVSAIPRESNSRRSSKKSSKVRFQVVRVNLSTVISPAEVLALAFDELDSHLAKMEDDLARSNGAAAKLLRRLADLEETSEKNATARATDKPANDKQKDLKKIRSTAQFRGKASRILQARLIERIAPWRTAVDRVRCIQRSCKQRLKALRTARVTDHPDRQRGVDPGDPQLPGTSIDWVASELVYEQEAISAHQVEFAKLIALFNEIEFPMDAATGKILHWQNSRRQENDKVDEAPTKSVDEILAANPCFLKKDSFLDDPELDIDGQLHSVRQFIIPNVAPNDPYRALWESLDRRVSNENRKTLKITPLAAYQGDTKQKESIEQSTQTEPLEGNSEPSRSFAAETFAETEKCRQRLLFVFDELDKLTPTAPVAGDSDISSRSGGRKLSQLQRIVADLKFILTETDCHYIFIAGKDVDDSWQEDQNKGEGLFESIFSINLYLPSFFSVNLQPSCQAPGRIAKILKETVWARLPQNAKTAWAAGHTLPNRTCDEVEEMAKSLSEWITQMMQLESAAEGCDTSRLLGIEDLTRLYHELDSHLTDELGNPTLASRVPMVSHIVKELREKWDQHTISAAEIATQAFKFPKYTKNLLKLFAVASPNVDHSAIEPATDIRDQLLEIVLKTKAKLIEDVYGEILREIGIPDKSWTRKTALLILPHLAGYEFFRILVRPRINERLGTKALRKKSTNRHRDLKNIRLELDKHRRQYQANERILAELIPDLEFSSSNERSDIPTNSRSWCDCLRSLLRSENQKTASLIEHLKLKIESLSHPETTSRRPIGTENCTEDFTAFRSALFQELIKSPAGSDFSRSEKLKTLRAASERTCRRYRIILQYLTYKGRGIPRKVLREFYSALFQLCRRDSCLSFKNR